MPASDSEREKLCAFSFGVPWGLTFFSKSDLRPVVGSIALLALDCSGGGTKDTSLHEVSLV